MSTLGYTNILTALRDYWWTEAVIRPYQITFFKERKKVLYYCNAPSVTDV